MSAPGTSVGVVGGGLAGLTAALRCADAGRAVTLFESRPRLGGLTHSFRRGELWVDNGQHVFLRCCTSYRALLSRLGVDHLVTLQPRMDIMVRSGASARTSRLRRGSLPAPYHLAVPLARHHWLSARQRAQMARAALALRSVDPDDPRTDQRTFGEWLAEHRQGRRALDTLWDVVGVATLNAPARDASLALAAGVFQRGLLADNAAADIGWSDVPLQRLHGDAASAALLAAGVDVRTRQKVAAIARDGDRWRIHAGGTDHVADEVVLAVPPTAAEHLLPPAAMAAGPGWSGALGSSPIVNLHVVYDRPVLSEPFVAAIDSPLQWVFDRTAQSGLGHHPHGHGQAQHGQAQYVAVSLSAADRIVGLASAELRRRYLPALESLLPAGASARVLDFFVTRERHATFRPSPGTAALRPTCRTGLPGLYLAGAWTATGWPATMEGAVRSGDDVAAALLRDAHGDRVPEVAA